MCRADIDGGRRCPSHADPVRIAQRNARRRELYAQKKNGGVATEQSVFGNIAIPAVVSNPIDVASLNSSSWKEFGFESPDITAFTVDITRDEALFDSAQQLEQLGQDELGAVLLYSDEHFRWINKSLYRSYDHDQEGEVTPEDAAAMIDGYKESAVIRSVPLDPKPRRVNLRGRTPEAAAHVINLLDDAMQKTRGEKKIVYRGVASDANRFLNGGGVEQYVDDHYQLGTEIVYDAYQSSSLDPNLADEYAGEGVRYEISSPLGVNITGASYYDVEKEVLLPRQGRYMVVGVHRDQVPIVVQMVAITEDGSVLTAGNVKKPRAVSAADLTHA